MCTYWQFHQQWTQCSKPMHKLDLRKICSKSRKPKNICMMFKENVSKITGTNYHKVLHTSVYYNYQKLRQTDIPEPRSGKLTAKPSGKFCIPIPIARFLQKWHRFYTVTYLTAYDTSRLGAEIIIETVETILTMYNCLHFVCIYLVVTLWVQISSCIYSITFYTELKRFLYRLLLL